MLRRLLAIILPLLVLALAVQVGRSLLDNRPAEAPPVTTQPAGQAGDIATVATLVPSRITARPEWVVYARVRADRDTWLRVPAPGQVVEVAVAPGTGVDAGQVLFRMQETRLTRSLAQQEAQIEQLVAARRQREHQAAAARDQLASEEQLVRLAGQTLARLENLQTRSLTSAAEVERAEQTLETRRQARRRQRLQVEVADEQLAQARAQVAAARLQAENLRQDIDETLVRAPFAGIVQAVTLTTGVQAGPDDGVRLIGSARPWAVAEVPTGLAQRLPSGSTARLAAGSAHPAAEGPDLTLIRRTPLTQAGMTSLWFRWGESPGADVSFDSVVPLRVQGAAIRDVLALPLQALYQGGRIYRVEQGRLRPVAVDVLGYRYPEQGTRVLVAASALDRDSAVLVTRLPEAVDGLPVIVSDVAP